MIAPKTWAATGGSTSAGAFTIILVWMLHQFFKIDIPNEVAQAITMILASCGAFAAAYFAPHAQLTPERIAEIKAL